MNHFNHFKTVIETALKALEKEGTLPSGLDFSRITAEPPRDISHGDVATNAALVLSKEVQKPPREVAELLANKLRHHESVAQVEIAGAGFINTHFKPSFWIERLQDILSSGESYGTSALGHDQVVNVEYVSTNPTGPLHVGHCRVAVFGDVLCALLKRVGYTVIKEYYVNDAGAQIDKLAQSVYQRYLEALGHSIGEIEGYPGDYLIPVGEKIAKNEGDKWMSRSLEDYLPYFRDVAVKEMMALIRTDLDLLGVHQDVFTSEKAIIEKGAVEEALEILKEQGLLYRGILEPPKGKVIEDWEEREQLLFKSTAFGDDVDRPLQKSDGTWTYFTPDIAYHYDKYKRGATILIDVLGADHAGYVKRVSSAVKAISREKADVDVKICQLVKFMENGQPMKMSKRAGNFISVKEVVDKVGKDVLRFMMLTRKNDAPLDFDFAKVVEKSKDNPVFYIQYAHARIHSVKRQVKKIFPSLLSDKQTLSTLDFETHLDKEAEMPLVKILAGWPRQMEVAALAHEPHRLAFYLYEIAAVFHALWNRGKEEATLRFIHDQDIEKTKVKIALLQAVANVLRSGLNIFGVEAVEEM